METKTIKAVKEGNYRIFSEVFDRFWRKVYRYFLKQTQNAADSKDLTQRVFINLWTHRDALSEEGTLNEQIFRNARLTFIGWLSRKYRFRDSFLITEDGKQVALFVLADDTYQLNPDVLQALESLPPKDKELFELRHVGGYSNKEIAMLLGIPAKAAERQLLKVNRQLQKLLSM
ncbi:sigma-70 family RNA polymerase sigma factor [Niabella pedocola]|uniref:Sigma-70 family RNA polymerase sigma factor n=1 Tax=Niabella pedocola TaxID=1752077 RepID=A0ABS8PWD4_9BACT|nr:sigma-70 family RNA polymerase sigma factor [Niabella pedocola]MCD2425119.1 sigma-70 family RNA polymerase sigma factor [Niabella pedocola]